jgi:hypothetical protein
MSKNLKDQTNPSKNSDRIESKEIPGLLHSTRGVQPIKDWDAFLNSLPKVDGEDWERFHEAIMENRAMRRTLAAEKTEDEC